MKSMERAVVLHRYWNEPGGGELVCSSVALALKSMGYKVILASPLKIDISKYPQWYGISLDGMETYSFPMDLRAFGIYLRLLIPAVAERAFKKFKPEVLFTDEPTARRSLRDLRKKGVKTAEYIHFPLEMSVEDKYRGTGYFYGEDPYILERYSKFPMNVYWRVYKFLLPRFMGINPFEASDLVLTNSSWTAERAKEVYGERPEVLNPPLPPSVEAEASSPLAPFEERENIAVMLGRFSEEKRYHWVIERVFPKVLKEIEDARLYIIGSSSTPHSKGYLSRIEKLAEDVGLRVSKSPDGRADLFLLPNAPSSLKSSVFGRAKVFLHATINEHWGIAVSEAMARGLPVVVHKSGGAWSDLAENGKRGIGYESEEEAAEAVAELMSRGDLWRKYSQLSLEKAEELKMERFVKKFSELMKRS